MRAVRRNEVVDPEARAATGEPRNTLAPVVVVVEGQADLAVTTVDGREAALGVRRRPFVVKLIASGVSA